jgi:hypothetical protein
VSVDFLHELSVEVFGFAEGHCEGFLLQQARICRLFLNKDTRRCGDARTTT